MRMGDEGLQAMEWAYGRLISDAGLADALGLEQAAVADRVWDGVAPAGTASPWVVFSVVDYNDQAALGDADRLGTVVVLDVKATAEGESYDALGPVARAIYRALHGRTNDPVSGGGVVLYAKRTGGVQYPEDSEGIHYRHLGHTFTVAIN